MVSHFCTYFNIGYLLRGLALYQSLKQHIDKTFVLWVLCFDDITYDFLIKFDQPDIKPIALSEFERDDKALLAVKPSRSMAEYFFTCTPSLPLFLLNRFPNIEQITYLDADLFFFNKVQLIFDEIGDFSIAIIPHRFPDHLHHFEENGIYNVGLLSFRNDTFGRECLTWWRERCLEWCYDRPEDGKFADQKYLDDWPSRFQNVKVLMQKGANVAPWNFGNYPIRIQDTQIMVGDQPLVFYHFQGIKLLNPHIYDTALAQYKLSISAKSRKLIYDTYIDALREAKSLVHQSMPNIKFDYSGLHSRNYGLRMLITSFLRGQLVWSMRTL